MFEQDIISEAEKTVGKDLVICLCSSLAVFGLYQLLLAGQEYKFLVICLFFAGLGGYLTIAANAMTNEDYKIVREHGPNVLLRLFAGLVYYFVVAGAIVIVYVAVGSLG